MTEIRRQHGWAQRAGLPLELISAEEARELFPLMSTDGVLGAACTPPTARSTRPGSATRWPPSARAAGVRIAAAHPGDGDRTADRPHGARCPGCGPTAATSSARWWWTAAGCSPPRSRALVDVRIPVVPMSHQYVVTAPVPGIGGNRLPSLRDPDLLVYYRQEIDGLVMGGYERRSAPAWPSHDAARRTSTAGCSRPTGTGSRRSPPTPSVRVPGLADVGIASMINGPEAFTPDNEFCLGETEVAGFFVAAGFCAHGIAGAGGIGDVMAAWVLDGDPGLDLWHMDVRRFGGHYRSPGYTLARTGRTTRATTTSASRAPSARPAARCATRRRTRGTPPTARVRGEGGVGAGEPLRVPRPGGAAAAGLGRAALVAVRRARAPGEAAAGLFDESSFAKIEITGPGRAGVLRAGLRGRPGRPPGAVVYTQALNDRGGIEMDVTVTRAGPTTFSVVTGTAFGPHDLGWLRRHARRTGADVRLADVTSAWACFGLWGPARPRPAGPPDPGVAVQRAFPYPSMREIVVGDVPVRALRVTYVGELGWELYCPTEYGAALWAALAGTGRDAPARVPRDREPAAGEGLPGLGFRHRARDHARRGRAGIRVAPAAAGSGGHSARARATRRLRCLVLDDPRAVALGGEPVRVGESVVGQVTSGGYGYTVGRSIAYAYLPVDANGPVAVAVDGDWTRGGDHAYAPRPEGDQNPQLMRWRSGASALRDPRLILALPASWIAPPPTRELRGRVRHRAKLVGCDPT